MQDVVVQRNKAPLLCFVDVSSTKFKLLSFKLHHPKNSTTPPTSAAQKLDPQPRTLSKVSLEWHDWQESMLLTEKRNNLGFYRWFLKALDQKGTCSLTHFGFFSIMILELATLPYPAPFLHSSEFSLRKCWFFFPDKKIMKWILSKCSTARKIKSQNSNEDFFKNSEPSQKEKDFHILWYHLRCCENPFCFESGQLLMFQLTRSRVNYANETPGYTKEVFPSGPHCKSVQLWVFTLRACPAIPSAV